MLLALLCAVPAVPAAPAPAPAPAAPLQADDDAGAGSVLMRELVERYANDAHALRSFYDIPISETRLQRLARFEDDWRARLDAVDFEALGVAARIDHVLLREHLAHEARRRARLRGRLAEQGELLAVAGPIIALEEARWSLTPLEPRAAAETLARLAEQLETLHERVERGHEQQAARDGDHHDGDDDGNDDGNDDDDDGHDDDDDDGDSVAADADAPPPLPVTAVEAVRAAGHLDALRGTLATWFEHYDAYVPGFAWWTREPYDESIERLEELAKLLRETVAGLAGEDDDPLVGDPIGREALLEEIAYELLPYGPEELLAIGEAELRWCEARTAEAAAELGFGDDWRAAVEHVKDLHVAPGEQDRLVAQQAREAIAFVEQRDLVTVPPLCAETWRVRMLSRESQRTLPFAAYGGQVMLVAYPTADMDHDAKLMAMRGNNEHFSRIVTPHELVPGHHLQGFMARRHATHRRTFDTPFLTEGWALYWEMLLWDAGWPRGPEDRIGMLVWRKHRAARILVSLGFHLGHIDTEEMIDVLVERVGLEHDGAVSEVRRYVGGDYGPLYQCAYMIGGLQLRALRAELVDTGRMTERDFHDAVLRQNAIPVEMIRAALTGTLLPRDHAPAWRFAGDVDPVAPPR